MELDIQNKKIELIQWLTTLEDMLVIQKIMELKKKSLLPVMTADEFLKSLNKK